ncbi:MAG TPA: type II secretion system F family protein [Candidatus Nanopelagicales bacterium]|nr:type II secretion system F family protein [Candidatus Nanopelagicales bacterium]
MIVAVLLAAAVLVLPAPLRAAQAFTMPRRLLAWAVGRGSWRRRSLLARDRAGALLVLETFAAELHAGRPTITALSRAAAVRPELLPATIGALRLGGDVPAALLADATRAPVFSGLAACWRVGERSGAGLAAAVGRLAAGARESERLRLELAAQTAEPRASARVLALLPAFGLALGAGLGADTLGWLLGTAPGRVVLSAGLALDLVGVLWSRRLVAGVVDGL